MSAFSAARHPAHLQPVCLEGRWEKGQDCALAYDGLSVLEQTSQSYCSVIFISALSLLDEVKESSDSFSEAILSSSNPGGAVIWTQAVTLVI